jgi:hypothetical protein
MLENESTISTRPGYRYAIDKNRPAIVADQPLDNPQQCCLSTSALADDRNQLSLPNFETDTPQHGKDFVLATTPTTDAKALFNIADREFYRFRRHDDP